MAEPFSLLILYYSGTGNTAFACTVAKEVAERAGHEVTMKTFAGAAELSLTGYDAYCFATPLQAWQPTKNVERFIKSMPPLPGKPAFLLSSSGGLPSQTASLMARWLAKKGVRVTGHFDLACPDSWPVTRRVSHRYDTEKPTVESVRALADYTGRMLEAQAALIAGERVELPVFKVLPTPLFLVSRLERLGTHWPDLAMGKKTVVESRCTKCGTCEKNCPAGAIRLDPFPVFSRDCDACWRCVNTCPEDCITTKLGGGHNYKGIPDPEGLLGRAGLD